MSGYDIAVELQKSRNLTIRKKGKKSWVLEGLISYPAKAWPVQCPCSKFKSRIGCRHVFRLLSGFGWSDRDIFFLPHSEGPEPGQSEGILQDSECAFCLEPVSKMQEWKCPKCHNLMHQKCLERWLSSANSCPVCRQAVL